MSSTARPVEPASTNAEPDSNFMDWLPHPAFADVLADRAKSWQLRLADRITAFAGAMIFVWLHAVLLTFVMIGQNRQAQFAAAKAEHDFNEQDLELKKNTRLTEATHTNTLLIHLLAHKMGITDAEIAAALPKPEAV
jgi:hypothetical protein